MQSPEDPTLDTPPENPEEGIPQELLDGVLLSFSNEEPDEKFAGLTENCFSVKKIIYIGDNQILDLYRKYMLDTAKLNGAFFSANLEGTTEDWVLAEFPGRAQEVYSPDAFMRSIALPVSKEPQD